MRSSDGLYKRGAIWWGWRRKFPGAALSRASTGCRDRQAARLVKAEWERMAADPARWAADKTTLREAITMYLEAQKQRGAITADTLKTYDLHCRQLAGTLNQDTPLKHIGHQSFKTHIKAREAEGTHPHTVGRELTRLLAVLVNAKNEGQYPHDLTGIKPRYSRRYVPRKRALTMLELMALGRELRADRLAHVAFVVATGCRLKESYRATGAHLLDEGFVYLDGTKTERARRTIPIAPPLRPFLEFAVRNAPGPSVPVVPMAPPPAGRQLPGGTNLPLFPRWTNSRRDILAACKRAGIAPCTWNDLRRTNATLLAEAGVPSKLGADLLGHIDDRMWNTVYTHPKPLVLKQQLDALFPAVQPITIEPRTLPAKGESSHDRRPEDSDDVGGLEEALAGPGRTPGRERGQHAGGGERSEGGAVVAAGAEPTGLDCGDGEPEAGPREPGEVAPGARPDDAPPRQARHPGRDIPSGRGRSEPTVPDLNGTFLTQFGTVALTLAGVLPANASMTEGLRSRRSSVRIRSGAPPESIVSDGLRAREPSEASTETVDAAPVRFIYDTAEDLRDAYLMALGRQAVRVS